MKTIVSLFSIIVCFTSFASADVTATKAIDTSGEGKEIFDVPYAPSEPDWKEWRERQNRAVEALEKPAGPPDTFEGNPIDWFIQSWHKKHDVENPETVSDSLFIRRVYLDVTGLLPDPESLKNFLEDTSADKRERLVSALLNNRQAYAENWMTFWNDLLRNDEQTNIDNLREPISNWLYDALLENKSYDIMVAQLLNPAEGGPRGFLKGINWRGRINASQRPVIQAAQGVGQIFLATTLKCASCHNHFLKPYTLQDTYGLAAFFSREPLAIYRCDKLTEDVAHAKFPFDGLGEVDPNAGLFERRQTAVMMVTSPKNKRFAETMVNRLWFKLTGRGMFEPVDDLDNVMHYPEMLDWMAYDFVEHGYDMKHTIHLILTSDAYAYQSKEQSKKPSTPTFAQPAPRRMSGEQWLDGIACITGYAPTPDDVFDVKVNNPTIRTWRNKKPGTLPVALGRPSREQVVSVRDDEATVLQMLEVVNGEEFAVWLKHAADYVMDNNLQYDLYRERYVQDLFERAYSREPSPDELKMVLSFLGDPSMSRDEQHARLEDFLWIVTMSPEFQFIR